MTLRYIRKKPLTKRDHVVMVSLSVAFGLLWLATLFATLFVWNLARWAEVCVYVALALLAPLGLPPISFQKHRVQWVVESPDKQPEEADDHEV